jgi:hypothetical protein
MIAAALLPVALATALSLAAAPSDSAAASAALSSFQRVTSVCSTCDTGPQEFKPAPGATERLQNPGFASTDFWSCYTDGCATCGSHVHGRNSSGDYTITFRNMSAVPLAHTQFWASNITIAKGAYYNLSFRARSTNAINISYIDMKGMESPWPGYSPASASIPLRAAPSQGGWQTHSVTLGPTTTAASNTRVTWWFALDGRPNDAIVTFSAASLLEVLPVHPKRVHTESLRATNGLVANVSAVSAEACAAACLDRGDCISFNFFDASSSCELNQYAEGYTVVPTKGCQYWLRLESPEQAAAVFTPAKHAVPYQLDVPTGNVTLATAASRRDAVFDHSMQISIDYLLRNYDVDNMLWWFRFRAGEASPPGQPQGWDQCDNNLRAKHMCLKGTVASTFLMGAGGILRWPMACCAAGVSDCCASRAELRRRFDLVLDGIYNATQRDGFAAAFAENETMYRENPNYVLSWLTHGLLEADIAQADGSGRAIQVLYLRILSLDFSTRECQCPLKL